MKTSYLKKERKKILSQTFIFIFCLLAFGYTAKASVTINTARVFNSSDINALDNSIDDFDPTVGVVHILGDLNIVAGGSLTSGGVPIVIYIDGSLNMATGTFISGDETLQGDSIHIEAGVGITLVGTATIHTNATLHTNADRGGNITLIANTGNISIPTGTSVVADGNVGGAIVITTLNPSAKIDIDGTVESQGFVSGTGAPGGGPITINAGCTLTISPTGIVQSIGRDPGADLVHLQACVVDIYGLVQSTGTGHVVPINHLGPPNRPDKPANSTAGVEVWASDSLNIDGSAGRNGEVNADLCCGGGTTGESWIDLFASGVINIIGRTSGHFAVHANGAAGNTDDGGMITIKSINGTVTASGLATQADGTAFGGKTTVQAKNDVNISGATLEATGSTANTFDTGGNISVRSFGTGPSTGSILNSLSTLINVTGDSPTNGFVNLSECSTTPFVGTITGTAVPVIEVFGACGGNPSLPCVQNPDPTCSCSCTPYVVLPASCGGVCCSASITIRKHAGIPPGQCPVPANWNFTSDIPGHTSFSIHVDPVFIGPVLVGYEGFVTFSDVLPGTYTVTEEFIPPTPSGFYFHPENSCELNSPADSLVATITVVGCQPSECTFTNTPRGCDQIPGCQWCNKSAVLSQVWQNPGHLNHDQCVVPDILVDVTMAHGGANDVVDASEIGTGDPATWSIQAAVDYVNLHGDPSPVATPGEIFIGVVSTQPSTVDPLDPTSCGHTCSRTLGGDNPHGVENVIVTNMNQERLNIFGCSTTMWPANPNLPVFTIQNGVGKVTMLDLHVKYDNVAGYLIPPGNADLVVVKNSAAWYNDIGYNVQDDNVQITGAQHINGNRIGVLVSGSNVILRTNSDVVNNTEAGIKITGNNNETNGNEVGVSGKPNALGIYVTGNNNNIHDDGVNYNTGNGLQIAGNSNTINEEDANNNGGIAFLVTGNSNTLTGSNQVKNNGGDGFKVTGLNNLLDGNEADNNGGNGFKADNADGASGNMFHNDKAKQNNLQGIRACGQIDQGGNSGQDNLVDPQVAFTCGNPANAKFSVVDISNDKSYKYDASFNLITSTVLTSNNSDANDINDNGTNSYVLDKNDKQVYRYIGGNAVSKVLKDNAGSSLGTPSGLAISGNDMWIGDGNKKKIYKYSLSAAFTGSGNINAVQVISFTGNNGDAEGLAIDATYLYVLDNSDKQFYRYPRAGGAGVASKVMKETSGSSLGNPMGAVLDGSTMWIVDDSKKKAYSYSLASLFSGSGNLNASSQFALYSDNQHPTGIAVGTNGNLFRPEGEELAAPMTDALLQIYPNPTSGNVTVQFTSSSTDKYSVNVADISGRIVKSYANNAVAGINTVDIDLNDVVAGMYLLIIQDPNMKEVKRIIVQK